MIIFLKLIPAALISVVVSAALYYVIKNTQFGNKPYMHQQIIIGIIFGIVSAIGNEMGVEMQGIVINARDAAPICAGLIFGGPSGIIAGCIGAVERWFSVYWGAGMYSREACTIATFMAGVIAALIRKVFLNDKRATIAGGIAAAIIAEVVHMNCNLLFHLNGLERAYDIVSLTTFPMIACITISVVSAIISVKLLNHEKIIQIGRERMLIEKRRKSMLLIIIAMLMLSLSYVFVLHTNYQRTEAEQLLNQTVSNIEQELKKNPKADRNLIERTCTVGRTGEVIITDDVSKLKNLGIEADENRNERDVYYSDFDKAAFFWSYCMVGDEYVVAQISEEEVFTTRNNELYTYGYILILVLCILLMCAIIYMKEIMVSNIEEISASLKKIIGTGHLVNDENETVEEYSVAGNVRNSIELVRIKLEEEMEKSRMIQSSAMPAPFNPIPEIAINGNMEPAREVGGDFYDYFFINSHEIGFLVADVSGKGIAAAMFMMKAKGTLRQLARGEYELDELFNMTNRELCTGNDSKMFVTVWMGIIDIDTGHVRYVDAGHNFPLLKLPDGRFEYLECQPQLVLGAYMNKAYNVYEFDMQPGSRLFLYTDGVTEARNAENAMYGDKRLKDYLNETCSGVNGENAIKFIKDDIYRFADGTEQFDDITMLSVDYMGRMSDVEARSRTFNAKEENFREAADFASEMLQLTGCSDIFKMSVKVAFEEIFVNIIKYAYPEGDGEVTIDISAKKSLIEIKFTDWGIPFNPLKRDRPDLSLPAKKRKIGGLGISMVRDIMDHLEYEYIDGSNVFIMKKITD